MEPNRDYTAYSMRAPNVYDSETNRFDYNHSDKDRFFFRWPIYAALTIFFHAEITMLFLVSAGSNQM